MNDTPPWTGQSVERIEDAALLRGTARFIDDLGVPPGTLHAAFVRAPVAHAELRGVDAAAALALAGVHAVITGADIAAHTRPFTVGVKAPMKHYALATDRVRYQGEPVALVLADDPYLAEDGAALVELDLVPLPVVIDPVAAMAGDAPVLHPDMAGNVVADRSFRYGDPQAAFAAADHVIDIRIEYPRNSVTPIECFGLIAEYDPADGAYQATSTFMGPFALHPVMALALGVPANRLRLKSPPASGGSFGVKQGIVPYAVACLVAARLAGRPVKWIEDRAEHLAAANSATNRVTTLRAAVTADGRITALDWDQIDDCGAYLKAPEPATIYRMHGNMTGAYDIANLAIRNRNVLTNKTPTGLCRGFGGPQVCFALERLVARIAKRLGMAPIDVVRKNLIGPDRMPYRTASGGLYDGGDYPGAVAAADDVLADLAARQAAARAGGRRYGIGLAAVVEPSISNMGYITTVLTAAERERAGPKGGALAAATVGVDALGGVTVTVASVPQGQGHRTVLAQVVADVFGLAPGDVAVGTDLDTGRDAWSVASGNYSSRFAGAVAGTAHIAATRMRDRIAGVAAHVLGCPADRVRFAGGRIFDAEAPGAGQPFRRLAATSHWAQATLPQGTGPVVRETAFWSPDGLAPPNAHDQINSSAAHGLVFDLAGVEVDPATGRLRIDRYVSVHDAGTILHPAMADGQIRGAFANALGAAVYERFAYGPDGAFLTGTFADYPPPTATEVPDIEIRHQSTRSPATPLGARGLGEGNCMSTPVCLANAVADALGVDDVTLPLTPPRVLALLNPQEPTAPVRVPERTLGRYSVTGQGETVVPVAPQAVWAVLTSPQALAEVVPGCKTLEALSPTTFRGQVVLGAGIVRGLFDVDVALTEIEEPARLRLTGAATGRLGASRGEAIVTLTPHDDGTRVTYEYGTDLSGKVAAAGGRLVEGAARLMVGEFFRRLARIVAPDAPPPARPGWWDRLRGRPEARR